MNALLFDTLRLSRTLPEKGHFTSEQAEALAEALGEATQGDLATKGDLASVRNEIGEVRTEIAEVRTEIAERRSELKAEIAELRSELRTEIAAVRTENGGDGSRAPKMDHRRGQLFRPSSSLAPLFPL